MNNNILISVYAGHVKNNSCQANCRNNWLYFEIAFQDYGYTGGVSKLKRTLKEP